MRTLPEIVAELLELQEARIAERDRRIAELEKRVETADRRAAEQKPIEQKPIEQKLIEQKPDDLKRIEGIGPKIAELLVAGGIRTFRDLAAAEPYRIKEVLTKGGNRFATAEPASWPLQANLAAEGRWAELDELQAKLDGGRFSD